MKRLKAFAVAVCLVVTMVSLASVAMASELVPGVRFAVPCSICNSLKTVTLTSFTQASQNVPGFFSAALNCGHNISRTTRAWVFSPDNVISPGIGDIILYGDSPPRLFLNNPPSTVPSCTNVGKLWWVYLDSPNSGSAYYYSALGHDFIETHRTPATCTTPGSASFACSRCSETKIEAIPITAHTWAETHRTPATCLPGSIEYTCSTCQDTKTEPIPALENAHSYEITEIVPAEYDSDGHLVTASYIRYGCSVCGDSYNSTIGGSSAGPIIDEGAGGDGMQDATAALGKTFLSGLWALFGIYVPGFSFTFGQMWLGVLLASLSILVVRMIFGFGGGPRGDSPRTSSTNHARISKERRNDEF